MSKRHALFSIVIISGIMAWSQTTKRACDQPMVTNVATGIDFIQVMVEFEDCGGLSEIFGPGLAQAEDRMAGPNVITYSGLSQGTTYDICLTNRCQITSKTDGAKKSCTTFESSTVLCFQVTTNATGCNAPTGFKILNTTEQSFRVEIVIGSFGGHAEVRQGSTIVSSTNLSAGLNRITASGLQPETVYSICFWNYCDPYMMVMSSPACYNIQTAEDCHEPREFQVLQLTPFSFRASARFQQFGGEVRIILNGQIIAEFLIADDGVVAFDSDEAGQLMPDTTYVICLFNACDLEQSIFSESECVVIRTPSEECEPPDVFTIDNITSDSFRVNTELGPFGGTLTVTGANYDVSYDFAPEENEKIIQNLPSSSRFDAALRNKCFDGSITDPTTRTVQTQSVRSSHGLLTPPNFINQDLVTVQDPSAKNLPKGLTINREPSQWERKSNKVPRIYLILPDPNSDGWDQFGTANLSYRIGIVQGCDTLVERTVENRDWPFVYQVPAPIPNANYEIHIGREGTNLIGKNPTQSSDGTVLIGPGSSVGSSEISTSFLDIKRWILHVPKQSGGFEGNLIIHNRFPQIPAELWVAGFDASGDYIAGSKLQLILVGQRAEVKVYPDDNASQSLYSAGMVDRVSHMGLLEAGDRHLVEAAISYRSIIDDTALSATVAEARFDSGSAVGNFFTLEARRSTQFWDGVAILNLARDTSSEVRITQRRIIDDSIVAVEDLGMIGPGQKQLSVVSNLFDFCEDCYYSVEAENQDQSIQVLGLRGSASIEDPVLVGSQVQKKF